MDIILTLYRFYKLEKRCMMMSEHVVEKNFFTHLPVTKQCPMTFYYHGII